MKVITLLAIASIVYGQCPDNMYCAQCAGSLCATCYYSYNSLGTCKAITNDDPNCYTYADSTNCAMCKSGYFSTYWPINKVAYQSYKSSQSTAASVAASASSILTSAAVSVSNSLTSSSSTSTTTIASNSSLYTCVPSPYTNAGFEDGVGIVSVASCANGVVPNYSLAQPCTSTVACGTNVQQCGLLGVIVMCNTGYYILNGTSCSDATVSSTFNDCIAGSSTVCTECKYGFYITSSGTCTRSTAYSSTGILVASFLAGLFAFLF